MTARIINADVLEGLAQLPDESVHCVVTSPPYWGLRDYGTGQWRDGDPKCDHKDHRYEGTRVSYSPKQLRSRGSFAIQYAGECEKCGAIKVDCQIGQEPTLTEHLEKLVAVFREVRRVLRKDGTLWLNYGDAYAGSGKAGKQSPTANLSRHGGNGFNPKMEEQVFGRASTPEGLKTKDLMLMPARLAIALQADGWYIRSEIIWHKPNPMPESVTDRPTSAHEKLFLLTKSPRYFYDADAVRIDIAESTLQRWKGKPKSKNTSLQGLKAEAGKGENSCGVHERGPNLRNVWTIATAPYKGAHFATFPPKLVEPCIKAGCPEDGTVLDIFAGSGTVAFVAKQLGRKSISIELNPAYCDLIRDRLGIPKETQPTAQILQPTWPQAMFYLAQIIRKAA